MKALTIKQNDTMESQIGEMSSLQEEVKRLYQSLKEEVECKIELEKSRVHEVTSLQETEQRVSEERDSLLKEIDSLQSEIDRVKNEFAFECMEGKRSYQR